MNNKNKKTILAPEAAKRAGVSKVTIYNWIKDFGIGIKIGGRWIVYEEELEKIMKGEIHYENQGRPKKEKI